jgi:protoporphyrinogen oxidase
MAESMNPAVKDAMHVVILGAGPAGLATGHELAAHGVAVTVLERNGYVGGLCRTVHDSGYRFDLGGHRWFTKNEDLNTWFRRLMEGELVMVERISRIYYDGKYYMYPVAIGDVVKNAGPVTIMKAGFAFVWAAIRYAAMNQPIRNMKDAYTAQFGSTLYEMFFRRYTEKVWGKPCEELSSDWVAQRSKGLSIWTVAREALSNRKSNVQSLIEEFMYPRDGYMRIPERMAEDIEAAGHRVLLNASVKGIVVHGPNDIEVVYATPEGERRLRAQHIVSTIPLSLLAQMITPQAHDAVFAAARSLSFRDLITVNLQLKRKQVSKDTWLYVQDEHILFGRLHEPKNWSRAMVPDDEHTSLVLECFCTAGDNIWSLSDDDVARQCVRDLTDKLRFIEAAEVVGWNVIRTRFAYPVYDLQYSGKLAVINAFLKQFQGLHIVGRTGTFRYNNADHSIEMGLLLARSILGYEVDHMAVNTEQEYHEIKRSDKIARDHYEVGARLARGKFTSPS